MAMNGKPAVRQVVTDPPLWRKPPASVSKVDAVRLFRNANPIFTLKELNETLGSDHSSSVEHLVSKGELKRQATGIFSRPEYDQSHEGVRYLVSITGAKPTTPERLARHAAKVADRMAAAQEEELRKRPLVDRIMSGRAKVFSTREAWDRLGEDPRVAIGQLLARDALVEIHAGLYAKRGVETFGSELLAWAEKTARCRGDIVRSIDASQAEHSRRDGAGPPRIMGITMHEKDASFPRDRIRISFNRMGWIQAVAGGPGNRYASWQSRTERTKLTKDAAGFIAEQIFGRDVMWGDLIDITRKHAANPDRNPATSETLPRFRARSYFDYEPRMAEDGMGTRCRALRDEADASAGRRPGMPCVLYADHREDKRIVDALQGIPWLHVVPVTLETGDFIAQWGPEPTQRLVFERKTTADFEATILQRDLGSQIHRMEEMAREGSGCFLVQQGDPYATGPQRLDARGQTATRSIPAHVKVDLYADMAVRGIRVIPVPTWQTTARAILSAILAAVPVDAASLPPHWDDPRTADEGTSAEPCSNQDHIAAGPPPVPSSE